MGLFAVACTALSAICVAKGAIANQPYRGDGAAKITVSDKWFVDGQGRTRLFHGINKVQKSFPWYPADLLDAAVISKFRDWGFNVIRLGMMWSGVETASYQYNDTYLEVMSGIVDSLGREGIYVIFDMHQDALSSAFGSYDGMPLWLLERLPPARHAFPWPFKRISSWFESYLTEACGEAFQHLYLNASDAVGHLAGFWKKVAITFKDNPYVLGYELINEPWAGNIFANPLLLIPGEAGRKNLMPLYDSLNEAIRQVDDVSIIFYEPVTWGMAFNNIVAGTGFTHVPGGPEYRNRSALAYHYYCWLQKQENGASYPRILRRLCDEVVLPRVYKTVLGDIERTGGASFLTEFGICTPYAGETNFSSPCEPTIGAGYKYLQSWAYWDAVFYDDKGNVLWDVVELFSRPYARATAGIPIEMDYNSTTGSFSLTYSCTDTSAITEIYASKLHYPNGYNVRTSPGLQWTQDGNMLYVGVAPGAAEVLSQPCSVSLERITVRRSPGAEPPP